MTICVYSHLVAVFVVQEIGVLIKSGRGHYKLSFETNNIDPYNGLIGGEGEFGVQV